MTKAPDTVSGLMRREMVTVGPDEPVRAAIQAMVDCGIGGIVVADDGKPVGVFTERDLLKRILSEPHLLERRMGEVMSAPVVTVRPDTEIVDAFESLTTRGIRRLPIVDEEGRLVGIVTDRDLMAWVSQVTKE